MPCPHKTIQSLRLVIRSLLCLIHLVYGSAKLLYCTYYSVATCLLVSPLLRNRVYAITQQTPHCLLNFSGRWWIMPTHEYQQPRYHRPRAPATTLPQPVLQSLVQKSDISCHLPTQAIALLRDRVCSYWEQTFRCGGGCLHCEILRATLATMGNVVFFPAHHVRGCLLYTSPSPRD